MNKLYTLVKRECWEHKWKLFFLPVYTALIFLTLFFLDVAFNWRNLSAIAKTSTNADSHVTHLIHSPMSLVILYQLASIPLALLGIYLLINYIFYPLQSLFQDRKDGSIAFFRSMPFSEGKEIASKLITILLIAPIFYWAVETVLWHLTIPTINHFIPKGTPNPNSFISSTFINKSLIQMFLAQACFLPYIAYLFLC